MNLHHVLLLVACICFGFATFEVPTRLNLIAAGLFCMSLAWFV